MESALIPVTAYIVVACAESYLRYPEMMRTIDAAMPAEEIGRRARRPGCQVDPCYLWSIANFFLLGRKIMAMVDPAGRRPRGHGDGARLLGAGRARLSGRRHAPGMGHGHLAASTTTTPSPRSSRERCPSTTTSTGPQVKRFNATLVNYLFLLYFDTRAGYGDTGPYAVPGHPGRSLLVRDFYRLGRGRLPLVDRRPRRARTTT